MSSRSQRREKTGIAAFSLEVGFFAGFIWGGVHWLMAALKFTRVVPGYLGEPFLRHDFLKTTAGQLAGYLLFILFSVAATFLYVLVFRKLKGPWPGMCYGILWWAILFLAGSRIFLLQPPMRLPWNSVICEFCLYLLWGLFIGYTAAIEFTDERKRETRTSIA
ncbi:hypothetical protein F4V43_03120 [Paenibacillus spiritus]|uniref:DUF1440 domain-containing protein n=1 Tax=Paenibacillus spiritus TaxID=2496557 RepID=A0A5J5GH76_9BACL|nr:MULTISPECIES: YqhR family membrane protein [Paenibacillus]KAA9007495.1 hypothetical protein F4V43_03120 [Paenibacillus spiritus]